MYLSTRYHSSHSTSVATHLTTLAGFALFAVIVATMPKWMPFLLYSLVGGAPVSPGCDAVNQYADTANFQQTFRNQFFAGDTITIDPVSANAANGTFEVVHWVDSTGFNIIQDTPPSARSASSIVPSSGEYSVTVMLPANGAPISRIYCTPGRYSPRGSDGEPVVPLFP